MQFAITQIPKVPFCRRNKPKFKDIVITAVVMKVTFIEMVCNKEPHALYQGGSAGQKVL